ncbi:MAG: PAS domain-containing protein, partial [Flavitalea sp.]
MLQQQEISSILTSSGSIYFIRLDLKSNFLFVNDLFRKIFDIDVSGQRKISFFNFLSIEDVEPFAETVQYIAEKNEPLHIDLRSLRKDGSLFWTRWEFFPIVENGELVYYEGVGIDITERKRAEDEKVFAKKSLQLILDNTEEGFIVVSPELKVISYNNRANEFNIKFLGKPLRQDNNIHDYLVNKSLINSVIDAALSGKSHQIFIEVPGEIDNYTYQFTVRPIYIEKNQTYGLILTSRDVTESKRAEQLLLDSEEKYRFLFFSNPQPMWVFDQETLSILEVNNVAVLKYGYSRDEFLNMTIRDIRPPEEIPLMLSRVDNMLKDVDLTLNNDIWRHKKKNGEIIFVEIKSHSTIFNGRKGFLVSVNDITRLIEAEKSLAISNERFKLASKATSDAIWDVDFVANTLHWGEGYERLFGYKLNQQELKADTWLGHIHPDDHEEVRLNYENAVADPSKTKWLHEYRYIRFDKSIAYVRDRGIIIRNEKGVATRMIGALQDITESKKYEENLFRERNLLRTIIDTIPDRIFVKDKNFRHLINNQAMVTVLGALSEAETLGKTMVDYFGPDAQFYLDEYD